MNIKYNLGLIKNKKIGFNININGKNIKLCFIPTNIKQSKDKIKFTLDKGIFEVDEYQFRFLNITKDEQGIIWFTQSNNNLLSGYVGFSLFDTYGFPFEMTEEIMSEKGFKLDKNGYNILRELQKEKSNNTYKDKSAF